MSPFIAPIVLAAALAPEAGSRFVVVQGVRVHYQGAGAGKRALVLIHGGACDTTLWRNQVPLLAAYGRVLVLDLPGHGLSDKPERTYDLALFLGAVDAVVRDSGADELIMVGQSLGAMIAYEYARRHPDTARGLIWVEGTFHVPLDVDAQIAAMQRRIRDLRGPNYEQAALAFWEQLFVASTPAAVRDEIHAKLLATPRHVLISTMENLADPSLFRVQRLDIPALAVFGAYWKPGDHEQMFRSYLPRFEMQVLADVGHYPMLEKPDAVNAALSSFLDRHFSGWKRRP